MIRGKWNAPLALYYDWETFATRGKYKENWIPFYFQELLWVNYFCFCLIKKCYNDNPYPWFKKSTMRKGVNWKIIVPLLLPFLFSMITIIIFLCILLEISSAYYYVYVYLSVLFKRLMDYIPCSFTTVFFFFFFLVSHFENMNNLH